MNGKNGCSWEGIGKGGWCRGILMWWIRPWRPFRSEATDRQLWQACQQRPTIDRGEAQQDGRLALENAGRIYRYDGFRAKTEADLLPTEYKYIWVAPERLCPSCLSFKNENANGWCVECNLPPNYARKKEKIPPKRHPKANLLRMQIAYTQRLEQMQKNLSN